jgi:rSAM/selenodomain-associated transferase 1
MPDVAVFAKAPIAGFAKTRLIPLLGAEGAAHVQAQLVTRAIATARAADIGPVTLWCAPDCAHPLFSDAGIALRAQPEGDLGARMLAAFEATQGALVLIGSDCPCLVAQDLRDAAAALEDADVAIAPAEDGGYGLIAARRPYPRLFEDVPWSTSRAAAATRLRAREAGLRLCELRTVWDVDTPADHARAVGEGLVDETSSRVWS